MIYKETLLKVSGLDLFSKSILGKEDHTRSGHKWIGEQLESWGQKSARPGRSKRERAMPGFPGAGAVLVHGRCPSLSDKQTHTKSYPNIWSEIFEFQKYFRVSTNSG